MTKHNTPALRFSGFDGEWDTVRMGDVAEVNPSADIPNLFNYVDLASVLGTGLTNYRPYSKGKAPSRAQRVAQVGDIFYQTVRPYQKNNYHFNFRSDRAFVFSTGYAQIRPKINSSYVFTAVQRDEFLTQVLDRCTGTSYPAIAPSQIGEITLSFPESRKEQRAIGELFADLDALIEQHRAKHKNLQRTKTALMQKMFPQDGQTEPELRLDGFSGEWGLVPFVDLIQSIQIGVNELGALDNSGTPLLKMGNILRGGFDLRAYERLPESTSITPSLLVKNGDFLFNTRNTMELVGKGATWFGESNVFTFNGNIARFDLIDVDPAFFNYLYNLPDSISQVQKCATGTTSVAAVYPRSLSSVTFLLPPTLEEQRAIGAVFTKLDSLISTEAQFINKLTQTKTALLQKMFV